VVTTWTISKPAASDDLVGGRPTFPGADGPDTAPQSSKQPEIGALTDGDRGFCRRRPDARRRADRHATDAGVVAAALWRRAAAVTNLLNGASGFQWSPDGTRLVVVGRSGPSDTAKSPSDVRHYAHANYKFNDSGWFDDKRTHVWIADVASGRSTQDHVRRRLERFGSAVVAGQPEIAFVSDRHGQGVSTWAATPTCGSSTRAAAR